LYFEHRFFETGLFNTSLLGTILKYLAFNGLQNVEVVEAT